MKPELEFDLAFADEMALTKGDKEWIVEQHRTAHAATGTARIAHWLKGWGILAACITGALALLGITIASVVFAVSEVRQNSEFRGRTISQLNAIEGKLAGIEDRFRIQRKLAGLVELPAAQFQQRIGEVAKELAAAREYGVAIDSGTVSRIRKTTADSVPALGREPTTWKAMLQIASALSSIDAESTKRGSEIPRQDFAITLAIQRRLHEALPLRALRPPGGINIAGIPGHAKAIFERIGGTPQTGETLAQIIVVPDQKGDVALDLDGYRFHNFVFIGMRIHYAGGPIDLRNVAFVNCTFEVANQKYGQMLVAETLRSSLTTFSVL